MHATQCASFAALLSILATIGCTSKEVARVDPRQSVEEVKAVEVFSSRDLDILFVVDNSGSMREEQTSLATNFDRFVNVLGAIEGGLPNVHIGVVSTDVGAGAYGISGCVGSGDNGILQNTPRGLCSGPTDRWIENIALPDGTRQTNYPGTLSETFSCIAQLGDSGCGFEQPLEAMRRALNGSNAVNAGFLRPDAKLAVVIISDEDDCSVAVDRMFDTDSNQDRIDSELGHLSSFRCFDFGVQCDPDSPRSAGLKQDCQPRENSEFMYGVDEYSDFLRSLKTDPGDILVAGIIGNPNNVSVDVVAGEPTLQPSCSSGAGEAAPGIRLNAFLDDFARSTTTTICNEDLSDALTTIASSFHLVFGSPCLDDDLTRIDGEPNCSVSDILNRNEDSQEESVVPKCDSTMSVLPCYHYQEDTDICPGRTELVVERGGVEPESGTEVVAHCEVG